MVATYLALLFETHVHFITKKQISVRELESKSFHQNVQGDPTEIC
jgi:hypothetical protein